ILSGLESRIARYFQLVSLAVLQSLQRRGEVVPTGHDVFDMERCWPRIVEIKIVYGAAARERAGGPSITRLDGEWRVGISFDARRYGCRFFRQRRRVQLESGAQRQAEGRQFRIIGAHGR